MLNVSVKCINYRNKLFIYTEDINFTISFIIKVNTQIFCFVFFDNKGICTEEEI